MNTSPASKTEIFRIVVIMSVMCTLYGCTQISHSATINRAFLNKNNIAKSKNKNDCGIQALATIFSIYGYDDAYNQLSKGIDYKAGISPVEFIAVLRENDIDSEYCRVDEQLIEKAIANGEILVMFVDIAFRQFFYPYIYRLFPSFVSPEYHYYVLAGHDKNEHVIYVIDSSGSIKPMNVGALSIMNKRTKGLGILIKSPASTIQ